MPLNGFKEIPSTSMVNLFPEFIYDKDQIPGKSLDIWNSFRFAILPTILANRGYFLYPVKQRDTLEGLAGKFYSNQRLWWITLVLNDVEDPFDFLPNVLNNIDPQFGPDFQIKILKPEFIAPVLSELKRLKGFVESLTESSGAENS
jgi:hypothetical protein